MQNNLECYRRDITRLDNTLTSVFIGIESGKATFFWDECGVFVDFKEEKNEFLSNIWFDVLTNGKTLFKKVPKEEFLISRLLYESRNKS